MFGLIATQNSVYVITCFIVPNGIDHWMDSTFYEVFILSAQAVNTPIINITFLSTEEFRTNYFAYYNLPEDITFTLNGSCPYFYFTNMSKQEIAFENYYDFYVPDPIEQVTLALAEPVPPDDYEMQVTVTDGGSVLERRDILIHVRDVLPCMISPGKQQFQIIICSVSYTRVSVHSHIVI